VKDIKDDQKESSSWLDSSEEEKPELLKEVKFEEFDLNN